LAKSKNAEMYYELYPWTGVPYVEVSIMCLQMTIILFQLHIELQQQKTSFFRSIYLKLDKVATLTTWGSGVK